MRLISLVVPFLATLVASVSANSAGIQMTIPCSQNVVDGRILVDGGYLPDSVKGYKVLRYDPDADAVNSKNPNNAAYPWSHGKCVIEITKGNAE